MGEAWFMGYPREIYTSLLEVDVVDQPVEDLQIYLQEIACGLHNFGHVDVWSDWFQYLLPHCVERSFEHYVDYLIEYLVTAFMTVMPDPSVQVGYPSFRRDALLTLGRAIMSPELWPDGKHAPKGCLHDVWETQTHYPLWRDASGDFSASMFFCLKYLSADQVPRWTRSVFDIPCPRWRGQVLVWLCGAKGLIDGTISQPSNLEEHPVARVEWAWSHIINGQNSAYEEIVEDSASPIEFLPNANRIHFEETVMNTLDEILLSEWLESLKEFAPLFDQITAAKVPERLHQLYRF
jgi:hypothetical protein